MIDMGDHIQAKTDQLTADDFLKGPATYTIQEVTGNDGNTEQPVNVFFVEGDGRPYRPCKSMRRVMVHVWGPDAAQYKGRSLTLFRDPEVKYGGMAVGGIRISHMSDMTAPVSLALMASKHKRAETKVLPLTVEKKDKVADRVNEIIGALDVAMDKAEFIASEKWQAALGFTKSAGRDDLHQKLIKAQENV